MVTGKSQPPREGDEGAKRPKTGGRVKKTVPQMVEESKIRSELAGLHDDTLLPGPLAAIYLAVSEDELYELRNPPVDADGTRGDEGPLLVKHIKKGAVGQNQPVFYSLGALKEYWKKHQGSTSHEVAIKSNMLGMVTAMAPFFVQPGRGRRAVDLLLGNAWDFMHPDRDERFARAARDELRVVWLTGAKAASSRWADVAAHRELVDRWTAILGHEIAAVGAAFEGSELHAIAAEAPLLRRPLHD